MQFEQDNPFMASIGKKIGLLRGLLSQSNAHTGPFYVDVDVTNRCNLSCIGCPFHGPGVARYHRNNNSNDDLPVSLFESLCVELRAMGTDTIILQGQGEPLLHPNIFDLIRIAKSNGFHTTVLSNGTLLSEENSINLIQSRLDVLKVSLWAATPDQYRLNYPGNHAKNFQSILDGLTRLSTVKERSHSPQTRVAIYYVFNKNNFQSIDDMVKLAQTRQCDGLYFSPMVSLDADSRTERLSQNEQQQAKAVLRKARKELRSSSIEENVTWALFRQNWNVPLWARIPCYVAWFHVQIKVDGAIHPCGRCDASINFGNLNHSTFREIWNGDPIRTFRTKTITRQGLQQYSSHCQCLNCCYAWDINQVHRIYRWFLPLHGRTMRS